MTNLKWRNGASMPPLPNQFQGAKIALSKVSSANHWILFFLWSLDLIFLTPRAPSSQLLHKVDRNGAPRNHHVRLSHCLAMKEHHLQVKKPSRHHQIMNIVYEQQSTRLAFHQQHSDTLNTGGTSTVQRSIRSHWATSRRGCESALKEQRETESKSSLVLCGTSAPQFIFQ